MRLFHGEVPAFLAIDTEPNGFQAPNLRWSGFEWLCGFVGELRSELAAASGVTPRFGWYLRMDPQVEAVHGRPDHIAVAFPELLTRLEEQGDYFGSHVHALRWSPGAGRWVHDFSDADWHAHCLQVSFDAFAGVFGEPPVRHRYGADYIDDNLVALLDEHGVRVDLTPQPGSGRTPVMRDVRSGVDVSPRTAPLTNCVHIPRRPYRPARDDFRRSGGRRGRRLILVPTSATRLHHDRPVWRQVAYVAEHRVAPHPPHPLVPSVWMHGPKSFWDVIERHLRLSPRPYVSLAVRTDDPDSPEAERARDILAYLPHHPLARRLRFEDPLEVAPALV